MSTGLHCAPYLWTTSAPPTTTGPVVSTHFLDVNHVGVMVLAETDSLLSMLLVVSELMLSHQKPHHSQRLAAWSSCQAENECSVGHGMLERQHMPLLELVLAPTTNQWFTRCNPPKSTVTSHNEPAKASARFGANQQHYLLRIRLRRRLQSTCQVSEHNQCPVRCSVMANPRAGTGETVSVSGSHSPVHVIFLLIMPCEHFTH